MIRCLTIAMLIGLFAPAQAAIESYEFESSAEERRFRELTERLRCPKCQNQSIAGSDAPISEDLRKLVHQMIRLGRNDEEIVDHLVARYGEFVSYRPTLNATTWLLWFGPGLGILGAATAVVIWVRRKTDVRTSELSDTEERRLNEILGSDAGNRSA